MAFKYETLLKAAKPNANISVEGDVYVVRFEPGGNPKATTPIVPLGETYAWYKGYAAYARQAGITVPQYGLLGDRSPGEIERVPDSDPDASFEQFRNLDYVASHASQGSVASVASQASHGTTGSHGSVSSVASHASIASAASRPEIENYESFAARASRAGIASVSSEASQGSGASWGGVVSQASLASIASEADLPEVVGGLNTLIESSELDGVITVSEGERGSNAYNFFGGTANTLTNSLTIDTRVGPGSFPGEIMFQNNNGGGNNKSGFTFRDGDSELFGMSKFRIRGFLPFEMINQPIMFRDTPILVPSTELAQIYAKDVSGAVELFAMDSNGTETQLSSHTRKAPAWLYDEEEGVPDMVVFEANYFSGTVRFTNKTRQTKLLELTDNEKQALPVEKRKCYHTESFQDYYARTGIKLEKLDWEIDQDKQEKQAKEEGKEFQRKPKPSFIK